MNLLHKTILSLIIIFTHLSVKSQVDPLKKIDEPKGNVKILTESVFYIRMVKNKNKAIIGNRTTRIFDKQGKIVNEIIHANNGKDLERITFTYDKDGDKQGMRSSNGNIDGVSKAYKNSDGSKLIKTIYKSGNTVVNKYNTKGQKNEDLIYKDPKNIQTKITYSYDKNGNQIVRNIYSGKNFQLTNVWQFYYDITNRLLKLNIKDGSSVVLSSRNFKYGKNGFKSELTTYVPKTKVQLVEKYSYANFDKKGNWLKEATFKNGKITEIRERKIQYY